MDKIRDSLGFIELDKLNIYNVKYLNNNIITFFYNNNKFYFKKSKKVEFVYNELIAEEIAKEYGIKCVHYDLASFNNFIGVISEDFVKDNKYIPIEEILIHVYKTDISKRNNLEDISLALSYLFNDKILFNLIDELINLFIYDILIGNIDRHVDNYGLIENNNSVSFCPLFDNENLLSSDSIYNGIYSLGIDERDYHMYTNQYSINDNFVNKFLNLNYEICSDLLKEKLYIINKENINNVLIKIENNINSNINDFIKKNIQNGFEQNNKMINNCLNKCKVKKY